MKNKYIICQRTFTYYVGQLIEDMKAMNNGAEPSDDDIWDMVREWAYEDMRSPASRHDLTWVDEDGNPLE